METGTSQTMTLSLILLDEPSELFGGVFTQNAFPGAPVILGKERLSRRVTRGVLVNNRIANVCAIRGREKAERILSGLADSIGGEGTDFFSASTGVIGWTLPERAMLDGLHQLKDQLGGDADNLFPVSRGIMTTDAFPKVRSALAGTGMVTGTAKGAGMIEPNMATMLAFILTDVDIPRDTLRRILKRVAGETFNRISIDGDQSTSDMVLLFSSGMVKDADSAVFEESLYSVCNHLAEDLVRNGEGTGHVIRVQVKGAGNPVQAEGIGKAVINSPLVKTAIYGNDPNVGRIIMAVGDYAGNNGIPLVPDRVRILMGEEVIFNRGTFILDREKEKTLSAYLSSCALETENKKFPAHERTVDITLELGLGDGRCEVVGSDLSYQYVRENADYRT